MNFYLITSLDIILLGEDLTDRAQAALEEITQTLYQQITADNGDFNRGIIRFGNRLKSLGPTRIVSALNEFGATFKRGSRGKIRVQPRLRRSGPSKSRQKQDNRGASALRGLSSSNLPRRKIAKKRPHSFAQIVRDNIPAAKKSGTHKMRSQTRYNLRKKWYLWWKVQWRT